MSLPTITLAATIHDPPGNLAPAIGRLAPLLKSTFAEVALNISDATSPATVVAAKVLNAKTMSHVSGEAIIGRARRDAVRLALGQPQILYSDFDHLLRWIEYGADDLHQTLTKQAEIDFLVVGRSAAAFAMAPKRLQDTERVVNHVFSLLAGHDWDLMFAVRRMSNLAAKTIVAESRVDTLANDVEWPLLAQRAGLSIGYAESDALLYRTIEEFGTPADTGDNDALQWIRRLEFAALHATAMHQFLRPHSE